MGAQKILDQLWMHEFTDLNVVNACAYGNLHKEQQLEIIDRAIGSSWLTKAFTAHERVTLSAARSLIVFPVFLTNVMWTTVTFFIGFDYSCNFLKLLLNEKNDGL